ncbi:hypothetical protein VTN77DRAFT_3700 [Rasamsonia byssochlamydoides]|uniref:uncharacterized protein n=1 Tax=Rasamsonia byssochlamydoides TaxID=89139 RepID=UPI0037427E0F
MWILEGRQSRKLYQFPHLAFSHITSELFEKIEKKRADLWRGVRFTYFADVETLIIKLPTEAHESAHVTFGQSIYRVVVLMGLGLDEFWGLGATKYVGQAASAKESDSSWKNKRIRPNKGDWPTLVIEAGMSESLPRLRSDARWWIEHSNGRVNIVLLIWLHPTIKKIKIEKWEPGQAPTTRRSARPSQSNAFPTQTADITIQSNSNAIVTGAPLCLEFLKIFERAAIQPTEHDIILTAQDLINWATMFWQGL